MIKAGTGTVQKKIESLVQIKGNGNEIIENDETIEVCVKVKNSGQGDAFGVRLKLLQVESPLKTLSPVEVSIGNIKLGEIKEGRFAISVPRCGLDAEKLLFVTETWDIRKVVPKTNKKLYSAYHQQVPQLEINSYKIYDGNSPKSRGNKNALNTNKNPSQFCNTYFLTSP